MRSSVVLSLALLAAAAPSIAAPVSTGSYEPPVMKRQASSSTTSSDLTLDQSGAFGWGSLIGPAISLFGSIFGNHNKREVEDLFTRALQEEFARADGELDESGAFGWGSLIGPAISLVGSIFGNHNKREFEELVTRTFHEDVAREIMARADAELDESGAFGWGSLIGPAISLVGSIFGNHNKREFEDIVTRTFHEDVAREIMARAEPDESGAFGWTSLIGPAISLVGSLFGNHNKREVEDLFTRALQEEFARELMARADDDESGAFGWTSLIGPAISLVGSLFGNHNKREVEDLFTRALQEEFARELMARADDDDSGAFGWTSLIGPAISLVGSIFGNHNKRDFEGFLQQREFVARSLYDLD